MFLNGNLLILHNLTPLSWHLWIPLNQYQIHLHLSPRVPKFHGLMLWNLTPRPLEHILLVTEGMAHPKVGVKGRAKVGVIIINPLIIHIHNNPFNMITLRGDLSLIGVMVSREEGEVIPLEPPHCQPTTIMPLYRTIGKNPLLIIIF